jgi:protein-S-isoprenylcysteine O-methyltransferase Ste14
MSLIPAFELGVWNAWLFMLYVIFINVLPYLLSLVRPIYKEVVQKVTGPDIPLNKTEEKLGKIMFLVFVIPIIYSIFLPIKLYSVWFYFGLIVYLLGVVIETMAMYDFFTTAVDKLVTKGIYRISRNPMYFGMFLIFIGIGIACVSWLFLLMTIIFVILSHILVITEERFCLKLYGKSYREYLNKIPRWIGIPKNS